MRCFFRTKTVVMLGCCFGFGGLSEHAYAGEGVTAKIRGRLQIDYADNNSKFALKKGLKVRRARLGVLGNLSQNLKYQVLFDFADWEKIKLDDNFLQYTGVENWKFTVGQHKVYHSLTSATSDIYVPFMERSFVSGFFGAGAGGKAGVSAFTSGKDWTFHIGVLQEKLLDIDTADPGLGVNSRFTWAPVVREGRVIHVGASAYYRNEKSGKLTFSDKFEVRNNGVKFVNSGALTANNYFVTGGELAVVRDSLKLEVEYNRADINYNTSGDPFWGAHASVSYFFTGEDHNYKVGSGAFGRVTPKHSLKSNGIGAIGVAARYGYLNYASFDAVSDVFTDDIAKSWTLGLNWIPEKHVRFQVNYNHFNAKNSGFLQSGMPKKGDVFGVRLQTDW